MAESHSTLDKEGAFAAQQVTVQRDNMLGVCRLLSRHIQHLFTVCFNHLSGYMVDAHRHRMAITVYL